MVGFIIVVLNLRRGQDTEEVSVLLTRFLKEIAEEILFFDRLLEGFEHKVILKEKYIYYKHNISSELNLVI